MTAHPIRLKRRQPGTPRTLVAPLQADPEDRRHAKCVAKDDRTGRGYTARTTNPAYHIPGTVPVLTYGAYFTEYRGRPEHKALGPDDQPCHAWTQGLLKPPTVEAAPTLLRIGKESLPAADDDPDPAEPTGPEIVYAEGVCPICGRPVTDRLTYDRELCSEAGSACRIGTDQRKRAIKGTRSCRVV